MRNHQNPQELKQMKLRGRLKLNFGQLIDHYAVVFFLLLMPLFMAYSLIEIHFTGTYDGVKTEEEIINMAWPWLIPALLFFISQYRKLRLINLPIQYNEAQFKEALKRTAKQFNWKIEIDRSDFLQARRKWDWSLSWGEMITIIKDQNRLYLNSICDPNQRSSIVSFGWNRRNIEGFIQNLEDVKAGKSAPKKADYVEKEWTLKRILVRAIAYPFCLGLIGFGLSMILNPSNARSAGAGVGAILIAGVYLYVDLRLIFKKRKD